MGHQQHHTESIHYKSSHFSYNDNNLSCTLQIPSLCLHIIPSRNNFQVIFKHFTFDYLTNSNWTKIILTNPSKNDNRRRLGLSEWAEKRKEKLRERRDRWKERRREKKEKRRSEKEKRRERRRERRRIKRFKRKYGSRWREEYEKWKSGKKDKTRKRKRSRWSRLRKNGGRALKVLALMKKANDWRQGRKLYKKLYKMGKMIGRSMRRNEDYKSRHRRRRRRRHKNSGCGCQQKEQCPCQQQRHKRHKRSRRQRQRPMAYKTMLG